MSVLLAGFYKIGPGVGLEKTCEAICRLLRFLQIQNIFNHDDLSQTKVDWSWSNILKCKTDFTSLLNAANAMFELCKVIPRLRTQPKYIQHQRQQ